MSKKIMSKEITQSNTFTVLSNEKLLKQMQGIKLKPERVKMPLGGTVSFEVKDEFGNEQPVSQIRCVILHHQSYNAYYQNSFDGNNEPPDCISYDGITSTNGSYCERCPHNVFEKDENGRYKAKKCKNKTVLYLLREGRLLPSYIVLSVTSSEAFSEYATNLTNCNKSYSEIVTDLILTRDKNKGGIVYSIINFKGVANLTSDDIAEIEKKIAFCEAHIARNRGAIIVDADLDDDMPFTDSRDENG